MTDFSEQPRKYPSWIGLRSRECYKNNLFPAIKWIKPVCIVNWRLLLLFLFIYLFIFRSQHYSQSQLGHISTWRLRKYCSTPWKWWWPFYRISRTYLPTCKEKAQVRSLFSLISRLLQIWWLERQLTTETLILRTQLNHCFHFNFRSFKPDRIQLPDYFIGKKGGPKKVL